MFMVALFVPSFFCRALQVLSLRLLAQCQLVMITSVYQKHQKGNKNYYCTSRNFSVRCWTLSQKEDGETPIQNVGDAHCLAWEFLKVLDFWSLFGCFSIYSLKLKGLIKGCMQKNNS